MITKLSHTTFFVLDQDKAYDFYVNKLGFRVNTDVTMENGFRWLTVNPPDQPDMEIILMAVNMKQEGCEDGYPDDVRAAFRLLLEKEFMGAGAMYTSDCRATYEELKAKGVHFKSEPKQQFYGLECIMTDGCGNWFSVTQPTPMPSPEVKKTEHAV